ncbi:hypothetical protein H6G93_25610 [Nostoc sp. FACHB-973]|nr:hypothetical protein [Nostoc sp. FACHB-973]
MAQAPAVGIAVGFPRLIGSGDRSATNQITLAATLPNAVSKRLVNSTGAMMYATLEAIAIVSWT